MRLMVCTVLAAAWPFLASADERALRFSITESGVMPLMEIADGRAVDGILHDLPIRLAEKVGRKAQLVLLPRLRIHQALEQGTVDVHCSIAPSWVDTHYPLYLWSVPFMVQRNVLVSRFSTPMALEALHHPSVGTVLGFSYPEVSALFRDGHWQRDDARTLGQVLQKLALGRNDYAISNELSLQWFNHQQAGTARLYAIHELSQEPVSCLVRNQPDVPTQRLLQAMEEMQEDGEFDAILQRYR